MSPQPSRARVYGSRRSMSSSSKRTRASDAKSQVFRRDPPSYHDTENESRPASVIAKGPESESEPFVTATAALSPELSLCFGCCKSDHRLKPFKLLSFRDINMRGFLQRCRSLLEAL